MIKHPTKQSLSPNQRRLVEVMQQVNFGRIEGLHVADGQPVFDPPPRLIRDFRIGKNNAPHPALERADFVLKEEVRELFDLMAQQPHACIETLVVQDGLPVRMSVCNAT